MINEFDTLESRTENFKECRNAIENLSIVDIVRAIDYIKGLTSFVPLENEVRNYLKEVIDPLVRVRDMCMTNKECPHCGCDLFKSDLPQYDYVCAECDENFYESEVK